MITVMRCSDNTAQYNNDIKANLSKNDKLNSVDSPFIISANRIIIENDVVYIDFSSAISESKEKCAIVLNWDKASQDVAMIVKLQVNGSKYKATIDDDSKLYAVKYRGLSPGSLTDRNLRRLHYIHTVPIDLITFPFQLLILGIMSAR